MWSWCGGCCGKQEEYQYEVRSLNPQGQEQVKLYNSRADLDRNAIQDENVQVTKVKSSPFDELKTRNERKNEKYTDEEFPPRRSSLGNIPGDISWKRISQIVPNPCLFDNKIEPKDIIEGNKGDDYFLSSVAALAENPNNIRTIFRGQSYNKEGIYKVRLRVEGNVKEVIVDDHVPVYQNDKPVFCQPNQTGEFWVLILEKAFAKVNGSYENILDGSPAQIFKSVTYAPTDSLSFDGHHEGEYDQVWETLVDHTSKAHVCSATTKLGLPEEIYLKVQHTYTLLGAAEIEQENGKKERVLRLRDPWAKRAGYRGRCSERDKTFWNEAVDDENKQRLLAETEAGDYGLFTISYDDFLENFSQVHYNTAAGGGKFDSQSFPATKRAAIFEAQITREGEYMFELSQPKHRDQDGKLDVSRSTLFLSRVHHRVQQPDEFEWVDGVLETMESSTRINVNLEPGDYVIYTKLDPSPNNWHPEEGELSIYSRHFADIVPVGQKKYPGLPAKVFMHHAKKLTKNRTEYEEGKIWVAWELLFKRGGFAYIAASNSKDSSNLINIELDEHKLRENHFKLKKPYKNRGKQRIIVKPGQEIIIVCRVANEKVKSLKFPPEMEVSIDQADIADLPPPSEKAPSEKAPSEHHHENHHENHHDEREHEEERREPSQKRDPSVKHDGSEHNYAH